MSSVLSDVHPSVLLGVGAAAFAMYAVRKMIEDSKRTSLLPPGPPAEWFWNNPIPAKDTHFALAEWTNQYGPVFSVRQGSNVTIVVGRVQAAIDILERHGGVTLSRPESIAAGTMLSHGQRLLVQPAGELFRTMRKAVHEPLQPKVAKSYAPIQFDAAKQYILNVLQRPDLIQHCAELFAATVILKITYGKSSPSSFDDPDIVRIHKVTDRFLSMLKPGAYLVECLPWLRYVPGYAREIEQYHKEEVELFQEQVDGTRSLMEEGSGELSFVQYLLENPEAHGMDSEMLAYLAGTLYAAGSDTTAVGMSTIVMAAALHPEAQEKVLAEIDEVLGCQMPTLDDMHTLPQLDAFTQEALRWRPILPLGLAHKATADFVWNGYHIPEGATIIGNHWALSRDPDAFPDPEKFDPQRWLNAQGQLKPQSEIRYFTFGFGRRACPGQYVANRSLFATMALLFWAFRVAQDPSQPINPNAWDDKVVCHALPFKVKLEPRRSVEEIRAAMAASD